MLSKLLASVAGMGAPSDGSLDSSRIIQGMSRELKRGEKGYRPEAHIGDLYFEGREPPIINGEKGVRAVILHVRPGFVETAANGELGTLAVYERQPEDAFWREEIDDRGNTKKALRRAANKNIIIRTLFPTIALVAEDETVDFGALYTMRITGKAIGEFGRSFGKPLQRRANWIKDENGKLYQPPVFGVVTHLTTELTDNDRGDGWYIAHFKIVAKHGDPDGPTEADLETGLEIFQERAAWTATSYTPAPKIEGPPAPPPEGSAPPTQGPPPSALPPARTIKPGFTPIVAPTPASGAPGATVTTGKAYSDGSRPFAPADGPRPFAPLEDEREPGCDDDVDYS
jgi:hypothetical protein